MATQPTYKSNGDGTVTKTRVDGSKVTLPASQGYYNSTGQTAPTPAAPKTTATATAAPKSTTSNSGGNKASTPDLSWLGLNQDGSLKSGSTVSSPASVNPGSSGSTAGKLIYGTDGHYYRDNGDGTINNWNPTTQNLQKVQMDDTWQATFNRLSAATGNEHSSPGAINAYAPIAANEDSLMQAWSAMLNQQQTQPTIPGYVEPEIKTLSFAEAQAQAANQFNPLYADMLNQQGTISAQNLEQSGLFGSLYGERLRQDAQMKVQNQKTADIAALAQQLQGRSQEDAQNLKNQAYSRYRDQVGDLWNQYGAQQQARGAKQDSITGFLSYLQSADTNKFNQTMQEAGLTGRYNGNLTVDARQAITAMLGVDPVTGKSTLAKTNADREYSLGLGSQSIQRGNLALDQQKYNSTQSDNLSKTATNDAIAQVYSYANEQEALNDLKKYGANMVEQGIDIKAVAAEIKKRFGTKASATDSIIEKYYPTGE